MARDERGLVLATLIRSLGGFELAEDALQDALEAALAHWRREGVPRSPAAWIVTTARRRAIDWIRRDRRFTTGPSAEAHINAVAIEPDWGAEMESAIPDERLRLIFTCCHPALSREAQVALTLRTLGGLTTTEIARSFLTPEPAIAQRLVRAKRKIADAGIPYAVPADHELPDRLRTVSATLYLVFNEGYAPTSGVSPVRVDLCAEAIRLTSILATLMPDEPEVLGLLALMILHDSRRRARSDAAGRIVLLEAQDRSLWDTTRIATGASMVERAIRMGRTGPYQVQAAIAALHATSPTAAATDWSQIAGLYDVLLAMQSTPVVALNRAAAHGMAFGADAGLALLDEIESDGQLSGYHYLPAARADLLRRSGRAAAAIPWYERALAQASGADVELLSRQLDGTRRLASA